MKSYVASCSSDTEDNTCQSNLSKGANTPWSQAAPTNLGIVADTTSGEIDPSINPQTTDSEGRYGWGVVGGCWYVVVEADGYDSLTSPVVGVPPEVTDLNLTLLATERVNKLHLPLMMK